MSRTCHNCTGCHPQTGCQTWTQFQGFRIKPSRTVPRRSSMANSLAKRLMTDCHQVLLFLLALSFTGVALFFLSISTVWIMQPGLTVHPQPGNLLKPVLELAIFLHESRCMLTLKGDDNCPHKVLLLLEPSFPLLPRHCIIHISFYFFNRDSAFLHAWATHKVLLPVFFGFLFSLSHCLFVFFIRISSNPFTTMEIGSSTWSRTGSSL